MNYAIYAVSWLLAVFIHVNTLKRTALYNTKESITSEIYSLLDLQKEKSDLLTKETAFSHKFWRIESKIKEFNSLCNSVVISSQKEEFSNLFVFDIENGTEQDLITECHETIEYVESCFHEKIQSKYSFFYLNRFEFAGIFCSSLSIYILVQLALWLFTGNL